MGIQQLKCLNVSGIDVHVGFLEGGFDLGSFRQNTRK